MKKISSVGLLAFDKKKEIHERIFSLLSESGGCGIKFFTCCGPTVPINKKISRQQEQQFLKKIDAVVSFGGDGSFISAARLVREHNIPVVGVNMGSLGFLTEIAANHTTETLLEIFNGKYELEERMTFGVSLFRKGKTVYRDTCLNEIVIKGHRLIKLSMLQANEEVSFFNADGLIIATPTGSTAYSLAAGGPIVDPTLDCVIITPLCSHSLTQKPVVTGIRKSLTVIIEEKKIAPELVIDGKVNIGLLPLDRIEIYRSNRSTKILRPLNSSYFDILRKKLNWG